MRDLPSQAILGNIPLNTPEMRKGDTQPQLDALSVLRHAARIAKGKWYCRSMCSSKRLLLSCCRGCNHQTSWDATHVWAGGVRNSSDSCKLLVTISPVLDV